ncbi:MAG TPA: polysaccharide biosynthesis/export family protein [Pyrinomonadaceae bacterium]|jgi:polysaccharide export outer membrane protein|nr:polysaccharide biosynthesis/export family protein [Pyrinomonadaceae bacterium]
MKVKQCLVLVVGFVCMLAGSVYAQESQPSAPVAPQNPGLDVQGIKSYLLGPGDVIDVRVFGQPDLSSTVPVDSDGNLTALPFAEVPIKAKCRTDKEVQKDIAALYSKFINNPQVSVRIVERNSRQPATVFGAVRQPTRVEMKRKVRLNELMAVSGGFTERASGTIQILHTEPLMCPEPGEEAEAAPIDGTKIPLQIVKIQDLRMGKREANPVIRPGDYVLVTEAEPVYITGAVLSPGGIYLRDQLMLSRAIAMVGGARKEAKLNDVRIYRQVPGTANQEVIHVDVAAIRKNQKPDFLLQAYDVIEVNEAGMFSSSRIGSTLVGALTGGLTGAITSTGTYLPSRVIY